MGIGVSYYGPDGGRRTFSLDGAPEIGSMAAETLGAHSQKTQLPFMGGGQTHANDAMFGAHPTPDAKDLSDMVNPGGCLSVNGGKLSLRGEENIGGGNKIYGSVGGVGGFWSFDAIDYANGGDVISGQNDVADGKTARFDGTSGATVRMGGRTRAGIVKGALVVKNYYRLANVTANGRIKSITAEFEEVVCSIDIGIFGGGKWCVRPTFDGDKLQALYFGDSASLSDDNFRKVEGVKRVDTCTCPNA